MKKIILVMLSLLVISMFLVGCTEQELSVEEEQELELELSEMSEEELDKAIEAAESEENSEALAGQAHKRITKSVPKYQFLTNAYKAKLIKINLKEVCTDLVDNNYNGDVDCLDDECVNYFSCNDCEDTNFAIHVGETKYYCGNRFKVKLTKVYVGNNGNKYVNFEVIDSLSSDGSVWGNGLGLSSINSVPQLYFGGNGGQFGLKVMGIFKDGYGDGITLNMFKS